MKVRWTHTANEHLRETQKYLKKVWGKEVAKYFLDEIKKNIEIIKSEVVVHQDYADLEGMKKVLITKHNYLIYEKNDEIINILGLINNYRDPARNYNEIINNQDRI